MNIVCCTMYVILKHAYQQFIILKTIQMSNMKNNCEERGTKISKQIKVNG